jgi:hypothetical protein
MLFGPKLNTVFASRWKALLFAASVLFSAYCFVPTEEDGKGEADNAEAVRMAVDLAGGQAGSASGPAQDPWKK